MIMMMYNTPDQTVDAGEDLLTMILICMVVYGCVYGHMYGRIRIR